MNQYTLIARKNIEKQYDSECTIYELKPNNGRSIKAGVKQLKRYLKAYELEKETTIQLVLIVY